MLDLETLKHFMTVAQRGNLSEASDALHLTSSALSKSLKRLEDELGTSLFDRSGRGLKLNLQGHKFLQRAASLMADVDQLHSEFTGSRYDFRCHISAPTLLQSMWGGLIAQRLLDGFPRAVLDFEQATEARALGSVLNGESNLALVTTSATSHLDPRLTSSLVGMMTFKVAVSNSHPLVLKPSPQGVPVEDVLRHDFVALRTVPFQRFEQQPATDGWRDDAFPRVVRYWTDDLLLVRELVSTGKALAFLPESFIRAQGLQVLNITGCAYDCSESVSLVWRAGLASGWIDFLTSQFLVRPSA